jgi:predicted transcriptional regulator
MSLKLLDDYYAYKELQCYVYIPRTIAKIILGASNKAEVTVHIEGDEFIIAPLGVIEGAQATLSAYKHGSKTALHLPQDICRALPRAMALYEVRRVDGKPVLVFRAVKAPKEEGSNE